MKRIIKIDDAYNIIASESCNLKLCADGDNFITAGSLYEIIDIFIERDFDLAADDGRAMRIAKRFMDRAAYFNNEIAPDYYVVENNAGFYEVYAL